MSAGRLDRLCAGLAAAGCDAAVLVGAGHAAHLAGYSRYSSGAVAVVVRDGSVGLVVPAYEEAAATAEASAAWVQPYGGHGFGLELDTLPALAAAARRRAAGGRIGVASDIAGLGEAIAGPGHVDLAPLVHGVRLVKDADEVAALAAAYALAVAGQAAVEREAVPGAREIDLFTAAHAEAQRRAGRPVGFVSDMLSGEGTADVCCPVRVPGERALESADVVVSDVAVSDAGYWGDSARTFVVGVRHDVAEVRDGISAVLDEVAPRLRPGTVCSAIHEHIRASIAERFPAGEFPHHGGHGVGVTVFEDPHLIPADDSELEAGMVLAVEPGVYFAGRFGVRVERMYAVTDAGGLAL